VRGVREDGEEAGRSHRYVHRASGKGGGQAQVREERGVDVCREAESGMAEELKAWDVVVDRISAEDEFFAKVVASQKAYAKEVMNYLNLNQPDYKLAYNHHFG